MLFKWQYSDNKVYNDYYPYLEQAARAVKNKWGADLKSCNLYIDNSDMEFKKIETVYAITDKILEIFSDPSYKLKKIYSISLDNANALVINENFPTTVQCDDKTIGEVQKQINKMLEGYKEYLLKEYAIKKIGQNIYLESANVFANEYVLIKKLFLDPYVIDFFIYYLYLKIHKFMNSQKLCNKGITLISASDTGAMIINSLMILFNDYALWGMKCDVRAQHLLHIGPKFNYSMNGLPLSDLEGKNYIYIYDFMCEGSEYSLMKNCLEMSRAKLVGAIGIAKFNYPRHFDMNAHETLPSQVKDNIGFLVDLEQWGKKDEKKYKIYYEGKTA